MAAPMPIAVAFSGGGVRSASFCSGGLCELLRAQRDGQVRIEALSSVSGGGYVASSYVSWLQAQGLSELSDADSTTAAAAPPPPRRQRVDLQSTEMSLLIPTNSPKQLSESTLGAYMNNMRRRSSYVIRWGCCTLDCCVRDIVPLVLHMCFTLTLAAALWLAPAFPLVAAIDYAIGDSLRCDMSNNFTVPLNIDCSKFDLNSSRGFIGLSLAAVTSMISLAFAVGHKLFFAMARAPKNLPPPFCFRKELSSTWRRNLLVLSDVLRLWALMAAVLAGIIAVAYLNNSEPAEHTHKSTGANLVLAAWVAGGFKAVQFVTSVSGGTKLDLVITGTMLVYGYVAAFQIFKRTTQIFAIQYSNAAFKWGTVVSWVLLLSSCLLGNVLNYATNVFYRWRLQYAFYHPAHKGWFGCGGLLFQSKRPPLFSELREPQYKGPRFTCNFTADLWRLDMEDPEPWAFDGLKSHTFQIVSVSQEGVTLPLLRQHVNDTTLTDITISKGMSLSGAAVSTSTAYDFGIFNAVIRMLGISMALWVFEHIADWWRRPKIVCSVVVGVVCVAAGIFALYRAVLGEYETTAIAASIALLAGVPLLHIFSSTNSSVRSVIFRVLPCMASMTELSAFSANDPVNPDGRSAEIDRESLPQALHLTDGGHVENTGVLALLHDQRNHNIVVLNGGSEEYRSQLDFVKVLEFATQHMGLRFSAHRTGEMADSSRDIFNLWAEVRRDKSARKMHFHYYRHNDETGEFEYWGQIWFISAVRLDGIQETKESIRTQQPGVHGPDWFQSHFDDPNNLKTPHAVCYDCVPPCAADPGATAAPRTHFTCCGCKFCQCAWGYFLIPPPFPNHATGNQCCWGPTLFDAYHYEGHAGVRDAFQDLQTN